MRWRVEVVPAAILLLCMLAVAILQLLGFTAIGRVAQTAVGGASWIIGLVVLGLCIFGPLIWAVLSVAAWVRGRTNAREKTASANDPHDAQ